MKKYFLIFLLAVLPIAANADNNGTCGENLTWTYVTATNTLTISGSGAMNNYSSNTPVPWHSLNITTVIFENGVTSIGDRAFYDCQSLASITIPNSVTSIGENTFSHCRSLTSIIIPNSVSSIGENTFSYCGLTSFTITNSVSSIPFGCFYECRNLASITIPNSVTSIGENTFHGCSSLTSITIPKSVTYIGRSAFYGCSSLTSVHVSDIAEWCKISFSFEERNNQFESNPLYYAKHLFLNGEEVINLEIPNGVTNISEYAFGNCSSLTSVTIPKSVTSIGKSAFYGCYRLHTINCLNIIPPSCDGSIFYCPQNVRDGYEIYTYANLHVPMGSGEVYSSAYEWRYFNKIKEDMESGGRVHYANLIVQQGTTGYTRQAVKAAEKYTIYIGSLGENRVNAVVFNGTDVTEEVVNGYYTTPEIKGESVLSISYETETSANSAILNNVRVTGYDGEIHINYIDEMSDVFVYSVDGELVGNISSVFGSASIHVPAEQLYIVKVGERTYKVAL